MQQKRHAGANQTGLCTCGKELGFYVEILELVNYYRRKNAEIVIGFLLITVIHGRARDCREAVNIG